MTGSQVTQNDVVTSDPNHVVTSDGAASFIACMFFRQIARLSVFCLSFARAARRWRTSRRPSRCSRKSENILRTFQCSARCKSKRNRCSIIARWRRADNSLLPACETHVRVGSATVTIVEQLQQQWAHPSSRQLSFLLNLKAATCGEALRARLWHEQCKIVPIHVLGECSHAHHKMRHEVSARAFCSMCPAFGRMCRTAARSLAILILISMQDDCLTVDRLCTS